MSVIVRSTITSSVLPPTAQAFFLMPILSPISKGKRQRVRVFNHAATRPANAIYSPVPLDIRTDKIRDFFFDLFV